mmetsp:Transcript_48476/g.35683  ORF Transcript_48476/g.35683 Transcript_48476/m.35683 type:complete len:101 (+) Transcript_48476:87-389(+)|eukprot:CAMPEP_0202964484 /NCGR_PEP_ID=MMETSP1396-20130829/8578_1 /ASSEMBLY_ACC=CAM_ASM_000872 /TAXON_ID= /ORGANISM="Pseudokeronopsis sp., Strain Brazil" /LENGTH=100 /DNA_ID=CAMNT_0049686631 /DNA_START=59 /DNA_END=361 /DNA_ORIENTATION=-
MNTLKLIVLLLHSAKKENVVLDLSIAGYLESMWKTITNIALMTTASLLACSSGTLKNLYGAIHSASTQQKLLAHLCIRHLKALIMQNSALSIMEKIIAVV